MAGLPTDGVTEGTWGAAMNEYLLVGHDADGTHTKGQMVTDLGWSPTTLAGASDSTTDSPMTLPNDFRVAWGQETITASTNKNTAHGLTKCFKAFTIHREDDTDQRYPIKVGSIDDTNIKWQNPNAQTRTFDWIAIGR